MPELKNQIAQPVTGNPQWYKDAIIYEIHVRAFQDSDGDGIGDFKGLTSRLDYLEDLGVTALWLLPFYPSPLRDDGYDIARYSEVHPNYGTLDDFKEFMAQAHQRGLKVITELVLNHTSDQHEWFQKSRRAKEGEPFRDFYVWNDSPKRYEDARIIFKDFEASNWSWDPVAHSYYWHRFFSHQPDLNWENPKVRDAMFDVVDFWLELGVDGLRLDAVPYLFEEEGTSCENLPRTHAALKELRAHIDSKFADRMLLAEANQWPEDAIAYFGDKGDECQMNFHFPLMPRLFMALGQEDRFPIVDILEQTPAIPDNCQWALFLRNHDELTLEMVTDEDRDYMYQLYAKDPQARINLGIRRRLAPLLQNDRNRINLLNGLLFSFPGTPVIYYGDEIHMGDNIYLGDRNGVRTPMQWSADRNAGFSRANPQRLYLPVIIDPEYHYEALNVEQQQNNTHSPLWWTKRIVALRREFQAFGRGTFEVLAPENRKILAYLRRAEGEVILVVANLSRFAQSFTLDLNAFKGRVPVEMFGRTDFPIVAEGMYTLTLGPHDFFWFSLEERRAVEQSATVAPEAAGTVSPEAWRAVLEGDEVPEVTAQLVRYIRGRRWFLGKDRILVGARIIDTIPVGDGLIGITAVEYADQSSELYALTLSVAQGEAAAKIPATNVVLHLNGDGGVVYGPIAETAFENALFGILRDGKVVHGRHGRLEPHALSELPNATGESRLLAVDQSNSAIVFGDTYFLKLLRRIEPGVHGEVEIGRALGGTLANTPPLLGWLDYVTLAGEPRTLGVLQRYVPGGKDAWQYTLEAIGRYFERVLSLPADAPMPDLPRAQPALALVDAEIPTMAREMIGSYLQDAELLGKRTAEMHLALAAAPEPAFVPEPYTPFYQRSLFQQMRTRGREALRLLRKRLATLQPEARKEAEGILARESEVIQRFELLRTSKISAQRMRCHGDYHLGQILHTGKDFSIIDFEGEPGRPLTERRIKRAPVKDIAGMLRSFSYAPFAAIFGQAQGVNIRERDRASSEAWARFWQEWVSVAFLKGYLASARALTPLPQDRAQLAILLDAYLLDKALYELTYELSSRPGWARIPLLGIRDILSGT